MGENIFIFDFVKVLLEKITVLAYYLTFLYFFMLEMAMVTGLGNYSIGHKYSDILGCPCYM